MNRTPRDKELQSSTEQHFLDGERAYRTGDYSQAAKSYRSAAEGGHVRAKRNLGRMYLRGEGVDRDPEEAERWLQRAALAGDPDAQFWLASTYTRPSEWSSRWADNYRKAAYWYGQSADQKGFALQGLAQSALGFMYFEGKGVPQNYAESFRWYRLAAAQGISDAQFNLGIMHAEGKGAPLDLVHAYMWFNLAAAGGNSDAVDKREAMAMKMTREQIAEGQNLALHFYQEHLGQWSPDLGRVIALTRPVTEVIASMLTTSAPAS